MVPLLVFSLFSVSVGSLWLTLSRLVSSHLDVDITPMLSKKKKNLLQFKGIYVHPPRTYLYPKICFKIMLVYFLKKFSPPLFCPFLPSQTLITPINRDTAEEKKHGNGEKTAKYQMSDLDSRIESFRSALQSDDERENVKTPSAPNLPPPPGVTKEGGFGGGGKEAAELGRRLRRRRRREVMVKRAELGLRVCEVILCLVSFCVMMSDKSRGWAGDSYYRYMEFRFENIGKITAKNVF